jgi:hypothetical protein
MKGGEALEDNIKNAKIHIQKKQGPWIKEE